MYLEEIVDNIQLENDRFECKAVLNRDDVVGWLKTIAGFANASGGEFYIGVKDKTINWWDLIEKLLITREIILIIRLMNI